MKRFLALVTMCLLISMAVVLTGCGEAELPDYSGVWNATTAEYNGVSYDVNVSFPGGVTLTLEEDGNASLEMVGTVEAFTWEGTENSVVANINGQEFVMPVSEDGVLTMEKFVQDMNINFEKAE